MTYNLPFDIVDWQEYGTVLNQAYHNTMDSVTDEAEQAEILGPIMAFAEAHKSRASKKNSLKSITTTMQNAKDQFTGLVCYFMLVPFTILISCSRRRLITIWRK